MKVEGIRLDGLSAQAQPGSTTVEAFAAEGDLTHLFSGQRLVATVLGTKGQNAFIELNGVQIALPLLPGLKPGSELSIRVARTTPKLLLEVAPRSSGLSPQLPPLEVGQEVIARVIEELPDGHLLIDLQGSFLEAEAQEGLPLGKELSARVEQLRPQLILRALVDSGAELQAEATRLLRAHLPNHIPTGESLDHLWQDLASFTEMPAQNAPPPSVTRLQTLIKTLLPGENPPSAEQLAAFVRDGGLHYEAKLLRLAETHPQDLMHMAEGDLKGLLLQVLKDTETAQVSSEVQGNEFAEVSPQKLPKNVETEASRTLQRTLEGRDLAPLQSPRHNLATSLTTHLEHIESQQAVNLLAQAQGEPYQLQLPFFTGQGLSTAFLSIEPDKGGNEETGKQGNGKTGKGYNLLFLLDLEGLGQTRIDARITEKSLWVAFYVNQSHSLSLLQSEFPAFRQTLQAMGYEEVLLVARPVNLLSPEKQKKFAALALGVPARVSLLDVKA